MATGPEREQITPSGASGHSSLIKGDNMPPTFGSIEEFCTFYGGDKPIKRLLIANNGNAAMKAIKSLRAWSLKTFSDEKELEIVGIATIDDELANSEYISRCDYLAKAPGGPNNFNYANIHLITEIAEDWDCDAVWPGWGHASEDNRFPGRLAQSSHDILWVGPPAAAMEALGCKIGSSIIAQTVGVPVVPWSGSHIRAEKNPATGLYEVPEAVKDAACVNSAEDLVASIEQGVLQLPLMLKAAAGGGGKGIRIVHEKEDVVTAFRQVTAEVKGSLVFAMKMLTYCRHLEVQVLADHSGNVISLGARDCSIQRRHQKIIEEGPPIVASPETIAAMEEAAVSLCKAVGYRNAATVEFLYDLSKSSFYFLEVNARLQVEHVVTEMLTDINLPAAQVCVAMGVSLDKIIDVKLYIDRKKNHNLEERHCIAARVTAEDAENNFQPTCGEVHELSFESSANVWAYFSIGSTSKVHQYSDSQFGHIFALCPTRDAARNSLILSLRSLIVRGEISTNVEALQKILETPDFISNATYTTWLEQRVRLTSPPPARQVVGAGVLSALIFAAVYKASRKFAEEAENFISRINQGQVPPSLFVSCNTDFVYRDTTRFKVECYLRAGNEIRVCMNGSWVDCEFNPIMAVGGQEGSSTNGNKTGDTNRMTGWYFINGGLDGKHRRVCFREDKRQGNLRVTLSGTTYTFTKEKDPTQIRAPCSGKLVRWIVGNGHQVVKGTPYAEIEIMKMYVQLTCDDPGSLTHVLSEGAVFSAGDLLATLELPEGQTVIRPMTFEGKFPEAQSGKKQGHSSLCSNGSFTSNSSSAISVSEAGPLDGSVMMGGEEGVLT